MFYLTTHSTHFIYGYMVSDIMVKDHSDSERGNPLPLHGLLFKLPARVLLYASSSHGALAGTRNSSVGLHNEGSIRRPITA